MAPAVVCVVAGWVAGRAWPEVCRIPDTWATFCLIAGLVLLAAGLTVWVGGVITVMRAYNRDELVTSGMLSLVQHPIYSAWIVFLLPAIALLVRSWPIALTSLVAYAIFRSCIHVEEEYLAERFGQTYRDYRQRVNQMIPWPHR